MPDGLIMTKMARFLALMGLICGFMFLIVGFAELVDSDLAFGSAELVDTSSGFTSLFTLCLGLALISSSTIIGVLTDISLLLARGTSSED